MMRHSLDPYLLAIAKDAMEEIQLSIPSEHVERLGAAIRGSGKMPKNVKQPKLYGPIFTGVFLAGKYRCLAFCRDVVSAARIADVIVLKLDEYRKLGVATNPIVERAVLNFTLADAQADYNNSESLQIWWGRLLAHLTTSDILTEADSPAKFVRTGKPAQSDTRIDTLERKLDDVLKRLEVLIDRRQTTIVTLPDARPGIPADDCIGWPLPASPESPGFVPDVTCSGSADKNIIA